MEMAVRAKFGAVSRILAQAPVVSLPRPADGWDSYDDSLCSSYLRFGGRHDTDGKLARGTSDHLICLALVQKELLSILLQPHALSAAT